MTFDLAIIGGGPAGYVAAERAGHAGLNVVLFEKQSLGGVCLNEGCIPTKTLLYSAKLFDNAKNSKKYGIAIDGVDIDYKKIYRRKDKVVRKLVAGVKAKMKDFNVTVVNESATIQSAEKGLITVQSGEEVYTASNLLICTGSEAFVPPIPGLKLEDEHVMTNREILAEKELPESLVIIGGGVIGMEFASLYNSFGVEVTVIEMADKILGEMDAEQSKMLQEVYEKRGVKILLDAKVTSVDGHQVYFDKDNETQNVEADKILVSVGRKAVTEGFGLENIGVELFKGGIQVNEFMETNVSNVYAAGDVTGFSLLAHTASREGEVVVNNLLGKADKMHYHAIPGVVYTNPEISSVGYTEKSATDAGIDFTLAKLPMAYAGRFIAENEDPTGECKVLIGRSNKKIIGVHMIGNPSSEMIFGACMAIEQEMTIDQFKRVVFPHPTTSEILKETVYTIHE